MKCLRYGPKALLFRFADNLGDETFAKGCAIAAELQRNPPPGMVEFVPAFTTVLIAFETVDQAAAAAAELARRLERCATKGLAAKAVKEIPVVYDGADLKLVADLHQLTVEEVIQIHSAATYKVYMLGFSPGFPYLGDLDPRLHTPRLSSPRARVAAGSVAIGGPHTAIYSVESPGGWNIIGHTSAKLFDSTRDGEEAFLLRQGNRVRFVP